MEAIDRSRYRIANVLYRRVDIAIECEGDNHDRGTIAGDRSQFLDSSHRCHSIFDDLRHLRLDFNGCRPGIHRANKDGGKVDIRKAIDAQSGKGRQASADHGGDNHQGQDWPYGHILLPTNTLLPSLFVIEVGWPFAWEDLTLLSMKPTRVDWSTKLGLRNRRRPGHIHHSQDRVASG